MDHPDGIRRALVSGASGFVGRVLCAALQARGIEILALMRHPAEGPWTRVITLDLGSGTLPPGSLDGVDTVFHLASRVHDLAEKTAALAGYRQVNVQGTRALMTAGIAAGIQRFIYVSSIKAMGEGGARCLDESAPCRPEDAYGRSKYEAEQLVHALGREHAVQTVVLRPPLVYGPGVKGNLERMLRLVMRGRFPRIPVTGNRRSMVDVRDLAGAALLAAADPRAWGNTYIVTDGHDYSLAEILGQMYAAAGRRPPRPALPVWILKLLARLGDVLNQFSPRRVPLDSGFLDKLIGSACYDSGKLRTELDFQPVFTLATALPAMIESIQTDPGARVIA